ncbi:chorismate--pyruvate lyase family protein [Nocardia sp. NPDC003979]
MRMLICHDGTLTSALEARSLTPVVVDVQSEEPVRLDRSQAHLMTALPGHSAIRRRAIIRERHTDHLLVQAQTILLPERLPATFGAAIALADKGLGAALSRLALEYRRELLWYGQGAFDPVPATDTQPHALEAIARCYRLISGGRPIAMVEERFPLC